jgi:hypothetical protein
MTQYNLIDKQQYFRGSLCLRLHGIVSKKDATVSFELLVPTSRTVIRHITELYEY